MGEFEKNKDRTIQVVLKRPSDKGKVFSNISNLKDVKGETKKGYSIREHLPEALAEERRRFDQLKYMNRKQPTIAQRLELSFKKGTIRVKDSPLVQPYKALTGAENPADVQR